MSFKMQQDGLKFLSELLAGSGRRINCMYVEYGNVGSLSERSPQYFRDLDKSTVAGYAKVPVLHSYLDSECLIHFDSLVCCGDYRGMKPKASTTMKTVTLAYTGDDCPEDIIICTIPLATPVKINETAQTSIHASMRLGA